MHRTVSFPLTAPHLPKPAGTLRSAVCASAIALLLLFAGSASAATTWTVNTTADSHDASCTTTTCSLRDALAAAGAGDTINFSVNGTITLSGELNIATNVTIQGSGMTVSGNHAYPVFVIQSGVTATISGLTIANGNGGSIFNSGTLTIINSTFSGSSGGGIFNYATLAVTNSTFSGNSATHGGGIFNQYSGTLAVTNSTFSGNSANNGGGIFNSGGTLTVTNSTFSGNSAVNSGGIYNSGGTVSDSNNLFFNNSGGDSSGFNLSSMDVTGKDPLLLPLGNYGGPTQTMLPLQGSPTICAGSASALPAGVTTDQRGFPMNTSCVDIGSVQTNYLIVNNSADSGAGSLRDAINQANTAGFGDIGFSANGTITLGSALPPVTAQVNLIGPGANNLTVSGANQFRVFNIVPGASGVISGLTITNGNAGLVPGGGIYNGGTVTVTNSTFSGNSAPDNTGGGIFNFGTLTVINSTFSGNSADYGGSILNNSGSTLTVTNSTFSGNSTSSFGGGIVSFGTLTVTNSIFSGNSSSLYGGIYNAGIASESNNLFFNNTVLDSNLTLSSSDLTGQDPKLAALGNYGGPTQTMLPLPASAAICAGSPSALPAGVTTDQRGFPRTTAYNVSGNSTTCLDIGAVQTNYQSIQFTNATNGYSANVNQDVSPAPNVTVTENGQSRNGVPVTLSISDSPTASGLTATTANGNGATFSSLTVGAPGDYTLSATLNLSPPTATPALSITTNPTAVLTVNGITATVSINNIPGTAIIGGTFTPAFTVSPSGDTGATSVTSLTTSTCTVSGKTVSFVGVGTCTLQAAVAATMDYAPATGPQQSLKITYGIVALYNQTAPNNSASNVAVKVQLTNSTGKNLSSPNITVTVTGVSPSPVPGTAPSGNFTFMSKSDAGPIYQLNVKTTGYPSGTYTLSFTVSGDPVTHTVGFVIQ